MNQDVKNVLARLDDIYQKAMANYEMCLSKERPLYLKLALDALAKRVEVKKSFK